MSANILDSLFVRLGFEVDTEGLKTFQSELAGITKTVGTIGATLTAAVGGVGLFVAHIADSVDELNDFAEREGVAADMVQALGSAAEFSGSSVEAMNASIAGLNQRMGEALTGVGRGAQVFKKLGLSAKNSQGEVKTLNEMLGDISDKMQGKSRQEQIAIATKLGIDRSLVPMLAKGREYMADMVAEGRKWALSNDEVDKFSLFQDAMDRLKPALKWVTEQIALKLLPSVLAIVKGLREWIDRSRDAISKNETIAATFQVLSDVTIRMWDYIGRAVSALMDMVKWLTSTKTGVVLLTAAVSLLVKALVYDQMMKFVGALRGLATMFTIANAAALVTSALIGALIIGIGLLVDDYLAWKEGSDSVIGDLVKQYPALGDAIKAVETVVREVGAVFMQVFQTVKGPILDLLSAVWNLVTTIGSSLWPVVKMVFEGWGYLLSAIIPVVAEVLAFFINAFAKIIAGATNMVTMIVKGWTLIFDGLKSVGQSVLDWFTSSFTSVFNKVMGFVERIEGAAKKVGKFLGISSDDNTSSPGASASPSTTGVLGKAGDQYSNSSQSSATTVQMGAPQITVNSPDPAKAGESVRKELGRIIKQGIRNGQSAVSF